MVHGNVENFDDIFSRFDTILRCNRRMDTGTAVATESTTAATNWKSKMSCSITAIKSQCTTCNVVQNVNEDKKPSCLYDSRP